MIVKGKLTIIKHCFVIYVPVVTVYCCNFCSLLCSLKIWFCEIESFPLIPKFSTLCCKMSWLVVSNVLQKFKNLPKFSDYYRNYYWQNQWRAQSSYLYHDFHEKRCWLRFMMRYYSIFYEFLCNFANKSY